MKRVFSKIGTLIENSVRVDSKSNFVKFPVLTDGVYYSIKFSDTDETIEFISLKKFLFGDKIRVDVIEDENGEYFCSHITTDKFGMYSATLTGSKENEITFNNLKVDSNEFIRQLSDYEQRFSVDINVVQ